MTRIGSFFTGYGGLDMAVESVVGGTLAWYSEIEPAACKVLAAHHPGVPNLGDITTVDWSCVEPVDVLTGGYPCQPFSHAGQRKGKADERHLYPYVSAAIGALQPRLVVLENVAGHRSLGLADVLLDLASLGYDVRWGSVRAADAGAPHGRERVFITAHPHRAGLQGADARLDVAAGRRDAGGHPAESTHGTAADARRRPFTGSGATGDGLLQPPKRGDCPPQHAEGETRQRADRSAIAADAEGRGRGTRPGSPETAGGREVPRVGDSGEPAADPSSDEGWISNGDREPIADADSAGSEARIDTGRDSERLWIQSVGHPAPPTDADDSTDDGERSRKEPRGRGQVDWGKYAAAIHRWEHVLGRPAPDPTTPGANGRPRLSPHFVEWMMGLPSGHVTGHGLSAAQSLKMLGNGVCPQQATLALRMLAVA